MNTRKITPGCLCIILGNPLEALNGLFCNAVQYMGMSFCNCDEIQCNHHITDGWLIEISHGTAPTYHGHQVKKGIMSAKYLLPIPGDMPPPESLQHRKPVPAIIEDEDRKR